MTNKDAFTPPSLERGAPSGWRIGVVAIFMLLLFAAFTEYDDYFSISKKDVRFVVPKGFPEPVYKFKNNKLKPAVFVLGRRLFYDPILSRDSSTSCASCHQRIAAFAHIDHKLSHGINGLIGTRNVPSLQNLAWQPYFMWDGGINHLEVQPLAPLTNPIEMDENLGHVLTKLQQSPTYVDLFEKAYGKNQINSEHLLKALTQFCGLMVSADSKYDRALQGKDSLNAQEKRGLDLFRANCAACHKEPLFTDNSFRNNGLIYDPILQDSGRMHITGMESDRMKFKVPSLRNIEMTYPYMHDGRFRNLKQVMEHYNALSKSDRNADSILKSMPPLSEFNQRDLIAFLKTLTDKTFLYDRRFADPIVN